MSTINEDRQAGPAIPKLQPGDVKITHKRPTYAEISWKPIPIGEQNRVVTGYTVQVVGPDRDFTQEVSANSATVRISDLTPFTSYTVKLSARTKVGSGPPASISFITPEGAPSDSPGELAMSHRSQTTKLSWTPVTKETHNGVITGYTVEVMGPDCDSVVCTQEVSADATSYEVSDLNPSTEYTFKVSARTKAGSGPAAEKQFKTPGSGLAAEKQFRNGRTSIRLSWCALLLLAILLASLYHIMISYSECPGELTITPGGRPTTVYLSWKQPPMTIQNGLIITGYVIMVMGPNHELVRGLHVERDTTSIEIPGLDHFTKYTFIVRAMTNSGCGPPASISFKTLGPEQRPHFFAVVMFMLAAVAFINYSGVNNSSFNSIAHFSTMTCKHPGVNSPIHECSLQQFVQTAGLTEIEDFYKLRRSVEEIGDWQSLCRNLEVGIADMNRIMNDGDHQKDECLLSYFNSGKAYWEEVVKAVATPPFNNRRLAKQIAVHSSNKDVILSMLKNCKTFY